MEVDGYVLIETNRAHLIPRSMCSTKYLQPLTQTFCGLPSIKTKVASWTK